MKKIIIFLFLLSQSSFAQNKNKEELKQVMNTFMQSIVKSDSLTFYHLFLEKSVNWVGVYKDKSQQKRLEEDPKSETFFTDNYKDFFRNVKGGNCEEKFDNIQIEADSNAASITFDYSFWYKQKMFNWGKEFWHLIKINNEWKITSVVFSMEMTKYFPQPSLKERMKLDKVNH